MAAAKKKYWCLNPVLHNGKRYTKTIDLTDGEAEPLLKSHAITKHNPDAKIEAEKKAAAEKAEADAKAKAEQGDK